MTGAWWIEGIWSNGKGSSRIGPYSTPEGANLNANSMRLLWRGMERVDVEWTNEELPEDAYDRADSWCGR